MIWVESQEGCVFLVRFQWRSIQASAAPSATFPNRRRAVLTSCSWMTTMTKSVPVAPVPLADSYRPLSLLAIVGLGVSIISLLVFVYDAFWLVMFFVVPGLLISLIASYRIRHSEGTLAGEAVAKAGMVISLIAGLFWATTKVTTYLIIRHESKAFLQAWLEKLRLGKEGEAFVDTVSPERRSAAPAVWDPKLLRAQYPVPEGQGNAYDNFRSNALVELLLRYGDAVQWRYLNAQDSVYAPEAFQGMVRYRYHLTTPALATELIFSVRSAKRDTPAGPRREWYVDLPGAQFQPQEVTPYGKALERAQLDTLTQLKTWIWYISEDRQEEARKVLDPKADDRSFQAFDQFYSALRIEAKAKEFANLNLLPPILLKDAQNGSEWELSYRGMISAGPRDVEYEIIVKNPQPSSADPQTIQKASGNPQPTIRIVHCRYGGERKRQDPRRMMGMPGDEP